VRGSEEGTWNGPKDARARPKRDRVQSRGRGERLPSCVAAILRIERREKIESLDIVFRVYKKGGE